MWKSGESPYLPPFAHYLCRYITLHLHIYILVWNLPSITAVGLGSLGLVGGRLGVVETACLHQQPCFGHLRRCTFLRTVRSSATANLSSLSCAVPSFSFQVRLLLPPMQCTHYFIEGSSECQSACESALVPRQRLGHWEPGFRAPAHGARAGPLRISSSARLLFTKIFQARSA